MIGALAALALSSLQPGQPIEPCIARHAQRTTVEAIAADPERWAGRCVTVSGAASGTTLYSSREGIYLAHRGQGGHGGSALHQIGLYSEDGAIRERLQQAPATHVTVTGTVDSCEGWLERIRAGRGEEARLVTLGGYCHWRGGAIVRARSFQIDPRIAYRRLSGERARRLYGSYRTPPRDWPHRAALEAFAIEFVGALRSGDRGALAALHDEQRLDGRTLSYLLDDPGSPFAQIRSGSAPQTAIFVATAPNSFDLAAPEAEPSGLICFCRTADCSGRWPISWGDAQNHPSRPFACTFVEPADWLPRRVHFSTPQARIAWLAEPARTAFRRASESSRR